MPPSTPPSTAAEIPSSSMALPSWWMKPGWRWRGESRKSTLEFRGEPHCRCLRPFRGVYILTFGVSECNGEPVCAVEVVGQVGIKEAEPSNASLEAIHHGFSDIENDMRPVLQGRDGKPKPRT